MSEIHFLNKDQLIAVLSQTKIATAIHIGEDAVIQMANQAMLDIWDKDQLVIGKTLEEALPELKGQPFAKMFKRVWKEGITLSGRETAAELKVGGQIRTFYFDFEYRAIKDESGQTICILHTATDVTDRVANRSILQQVYDREEALAREQALNEELAASNEELNAVNEELSQSQEELVSLNEDLERRVEARVKDLSDSEARYRRISDELAAINEEMTASNEELALAHEHLKQTFDVLEDKEIALRLAIEAANFGTWHIHSESRAFVTSARLRELFGFHPDQEITIEDALGQVIEEYRGYVAEKLENAISFNGDYDISYPVIGYHDKETRWLRAVGNLKADKSGEFSSFTGVVMDISILKKDEQRKNDFIAMVSHELKTPLTSLNGHVQILQRKVIGFQDSFVNNSLELAAKQVKKMTSMINGFLNVSRLESGKIVLNLSHFSLTDLIGVVIEESRMMDTSHVIHFESCGKTPVYADYDKIGNVIVNLIGNAVKYAPMAKNIEVNCSIINQMVQVSVKDHGIGISTKDIDKLFDRYYRVESESHVSGFGIGLYLSAEIIDRHNGRIWVESELGNGAIFYFNLPLYKDNDI
ncbi:signal transduction histidine kinase [Pedobacter cryoconitis]|uniref:histidine kinase n=1 Tax=Pedobacter cryoconitis TaxID=188932 RepID=A0A7W9DZB7_9SPHI|nr:ATP-binding protein [Pedobacter cryoconitis]MBB5636893.1 signal transduction histidine kinase [Pedobacter cryoconitis]MBB6271292.1 signal transduction histidine kinase [Pedobacter cryoconitis]